MKRMRKRSWLRSQARTLSNPGWLGAQVASWAALSPSLLPRPWASTAIVTFGSQLTGNIVGVAVGYTQRRIQRRISAAVPWQLPRSSRTKRLIIPAVVHTGMGLTTATLWLRSLHRQRELGALVGLDGVTSARAHLAGTVVATAAFATSRGFAAGADWMYDHLRHSIRPWVPRGVAPALAGVLVGGSVALTVDKLVIRRTLEAISRNAEEVNRRLLPGRVQPWEPERSGSPWSLEPWHALGAQGRVMVSDGPRARDISAVMKQERNCVMEPMRLYAGKVAGRSLQAQADLLVRELHRTGAFRRSHLVIHTSTGTGWISPWHMAAVEFLTLGDCAQVGFQYSHLRSPLAWLADHDTAPQAARVVFERIYREWSQLPAQARPKLYVSGESLGAFGGSSAFADADDLLEKVDGAVFTGAPRFTPIWEELVPARDPGSLEIEPVIDGGKHIRFFADRVYERLFPSKKEQTEQGQAALEQTAAAPWLFPRIVFLQNPSDPIVWWDYPLAWRRPDWLREPRGTGVLPSIRWYPAVTFLQVLIDGLVSTDTPADMGHRYEDSVVPAWAAVLGLDSSVGAPVSDEVADAGADDENPREFGDTEPGNTEAETTVGLGSVAPLNEALKPIRRKQLKRIVKWIRRMSTTHS